MRKIKVNTGTYLQHKGQHKSYIYASATHSRHYAGKIDFNAILSIIFIILEAEMFKLRRLTGLTAYVSAGLAN